MSRTLLFVDDDLDVREAFTDLFEFTGWTVFARRRRAGGARLARREPGRPT